MKNNKANMWRFPSNNFGKDHGLSDGGVETFKGTPIASLARELCQNSLDAKNRSLNNVPVIMEFKSFEVSRDDILGIEELTAEIKNCLDYQKDDTVSKKTLLEMYDAVREKKISCLRISDFNTTGLVGISSNSGAYYSLTKGSGICDKPDGSGGSKGVGKYATFVNSSFRTVFYSTYTINNETGFTGIVELCSAPIKGKEDKTQGTGYYSCNDKNYPVLEPFSLDKKFVRKDKNFGTDVYILGFNNSKKWKNEIVTKILDSFIVAIQFGDLEVIVDDIHINSKTLKEIVNKEGLLVPNKSADIIAQYELLNEFDRLEELDIDDYGKVNLYLKKYDKSSASKAVNKFIMVRYPYMKITDIQASSRFAFSALCIIENNFLNSLLRKMENPQHDRWEKSRITNIDERNEASNVFNELKVIINKSLNDFLSDHNDTEGVIEKASEFLSSDEDASMGDITGNEESFKKVENIEIGKIKKVKPKSKIGDSEIEDIESQQPNFGDTGSADPNFIPNSSGGTGVPNSKTEAGKSEGSSEGNIETMKKVNLTGLIIKFICTNRLAGEYVIVFNSLYDVEKAEINLFSVDELGSLYKVNFERCILSGQECSINENRVLNISLKKGERYMFNCKVSKKELFSSEVKVYEIK